MIARDRNDVQCSATHQILPVSVGRVSVDEISDAALQVNHVVVCGLHPIGDKRQIALDEPVLV